MRGFNTVVRLITQSVLLLAVAIAAPMSGGKLALSRAAAAI
jgi:hypothetical protein